MRLLPRPPTTGTGPLCSPSDAARQYYRGGWRSGRGPVTRSAGGKQGSHVLDRGGGEVTLEPGGHQVFDTVDLELARIRTLAHTTAIGSLTGVGRKVDEPRAPTESILVLERPGSEVGKP
jgi:hypothetical protein